MHKKVIVILTLGIMVFSLSACKDNPDSIVKNKDMDQLIEKAETKGESNVGVDELKSQNESYQANVKDDSLKVSLDINAEVQVPEADKMSVIRVSQNQVSNELLNKVRKELMGDTPLYDGTVLMMRTKKAIEDEMKLFRDQMKELESSTETSEKDKKVLKKEYQNSINSLEKEYEKASKEIDITKQVSDYKLHSVADEYKKNKDNEYYSWMYSMDKKIQSYYGITDGSDGGYGSLSALNSPDYGNRIIYRKDYHGYEFTSSVISNGHEQSRWKTADMPDQMQSEGEQSFVKASEDTVNLSKEDAVKQADTFLANIGVKGFDQYECDIYTEKADIRYQCDVDGIPLRTYYIIRYMRKIDGVFVTASGLDKHREDWDGKNYIKQNWPEESIEFRINDNGIVGFDYIAPIQVKETVVEETSLQSFEEIKKTFEKMAVIANANQQDTPVTITIDKVVFSYSRISEKDSFTTGLLVPVWDFYGKSDSDEAAKGTDGERIIMTINAIDGSVIDRELGY